MKRFLKKLGLEEKEILIYLACLENTKNTPVSLAEQTGVKRGTVYLGLKKLKQKGLVGYQIKDKRRFVFAIEPKIALESYLDKKKSLLKDAEKYFEKNKDRMRAEQDQVSKPTEVFYFDHKMGAKMLIDTIIQEKLNINYLGKMQLIHELIPKKEFFQKMTARRLKQASKLYAITNKDIKNDSFHKDELGGFRNYRFVSKEFSASSAKAIFGDHIAHFSKNERGNNIVVIKDEQMAKFEKYMFKRMWDLLEN